MSRWLDRWYDVAQVCIYIGIRFLNRLILSQSWRTSLSKDWWYRVTRQILHLINVEHVATPVHPLLPFDTGVDVDVVLTNENR